MNQWNKEILQELEGCNIPHSGLEKDEQERILKLIQNQMGASCAHAEHSAKTKRVNRYSRKTVRIMMVAAVFVTASALLLGAARLFDWKIMMDGEIQQGNNGDEIVVGDGFAAMGIDEINTIDETVIQELKYPDETPNQTPQSGELSLFTAVSEDKMNWSHENGVTEDEALEFDHIKALAKNAEARVFLPLQIDNSYEVLEGFTKFYAKADQLKKAKEVYSDYGEWKNQQVFKLPEGYEKNVRQMSYGLKNPEGDEFRLSVYNATSNSEVYGGGSDAVIEKLQIDGFDSVVYVNDSGERTLHTWRKIPKIETVNFESFGKNSRPKDNLIDIIKLPPNETLEWQSLDISSKTLTKDELIEMIKSINLSEE